MALISASTSLPPDSLTVTCWPTLKSLMRIFLEDCADSITRKLRQGSKIGCWKHRGRIVERQTVPVDAIPCVAGSPALGEVTEATCQQGCASVAWRLARTKTHFQPKT